MKHSVDRGLLAFAALLLACPLAFADLAPVTNLAQVPNVLVVRDLQQFAGEVRSAAGTGGREIELPRIRLRISDELAERLRRMPELPDVPTVAESGLRGFEVTSWYGIVTRAGTPASIITKVQRDMAEALRQDDVRAKLAGAGLEPVGSSPDQFAAMIKAETRKWGDIVRKANITVD